jgi:hypothetical protein
MYFRELRNNFWDLIYFNTLMRIRDGKKVRIRDPGWKKFETRWPRSFLPLDVVSLDHVELHHVLVVGLRLLHLVLEQVVRRTELGPLNTIPMSFKTCSVANPNYFIRFGCDFGQVSVPVPAPVSVPAPFPVPAMCLDQKSSLKKLFG